MKNPWVILLLLAAVAAGAFFMGRRAGESESPAAPVAAVAAPAADQADASPAANASPEPVRTFRGPDGRAHIISYDETHLANSNDPEQVRKALLSDMKYFPKNIEDAYNLSPADVQAILAGSKAVPDFMLPEPGAPGPGK